MISQKYHIILSNCNFKLLFIHLFISYNYMKNSLAHKIPYLQFINSLKFKFFNANYPNPCS